MFSEEFELKLDRLSFAIQHFPVNLINFEMIALAVFTIYLIFYLYFSFRSFNTIEIIQNSFNESKFIKMVI